MRALLALVLLAVPLTPAPAIDPVVGHDEQLEVRVDGDFNADGTPDLAYVAGSEDTRTLVVSLVDGPAESLTLDTSPLGAGTLAFANGVLVFEDLTGGTTAYATTRRYRFDPAADRLRLIGFDTTFYSRTYAHDGFELSWNLLTGKLVTRALHLNVKGGDAAYDPIIERSLRRKRGKLWLSDTPDPEALMDEVRGD